MRFLLYGSGLLLLATLLLATIVRLVLHWRGASPQRYWRRTLLIHLVLLPVHLFATMPAILGWFGARMVQTRGDERAYAGPWIDARGDWIPQSRESLEAEAESGAAETERAAREAFRVSLQASDGVALRAFLVPPRNQPPVISVVMVHGLFRGALELEPVGVMFRDLGAEVLLLEMRNHGGSDRTPATFGLRESRDVIAAVEWLRARPEHGDRRIAVFGVSMGTSAVSLAMRELTGISGLMLDAPMDDLWRTANRLFDSDRATRRGLGFPWPFRSLVLMGLELWSGFRCKDVRPGDVLRSLDVDLPIWMVGAGQDFRMPPDEVRQLFEDLPVTEKKLWIREDSDHGRVWIDAPDEYRAYLTEFVAATLR